MEENSQKNVDINNTTSFDNQVSGLNEVDVNKLKPYLLHGVTGSGKTYVYVKLIEEVLRAGKEAILLVPEISLTPQVVNIFKSHFGKVVAILHSSLSDGEKPDSSFTFSAREVNSSVRCSRPVFAISSGIANRQESDAAPSTRAWRAVISMIWCRHRVTERPFSSSHLRQV